MDIRKAVEIVSRKTSIPSDGESFQDIEKAYDIAIACMQKEICATCANNTEYSPPHTCDVCTSLDEDAYCMWKPKEDDCCGKQRENVVEAFKCKASCLGLTSEEYRIYRELLTEEEKAYRRTSVENNMKIRMRCDETSKAVVDFEREHGLLDNAIHPHI